ncbi:isochorismate synthase [Paenibacillus macquariensis subsp. defensor]|nr:isochorismate synthase [Paenibacillus macquariensis subsp. defensor]
MLKNEVAPAVATQLLEDYREGSSFFWSSPERTLLARGVHARLLSNEHGESNNFENLPERIAELLAHTKKSGHDISVVVGAIPFDHTKPSELIVPMSAEWAGPLLHNSEIKVNKSLITDYEAQEVPEAAEFAKGVNQVLLRLAQGDVQKVVLSRSIHITLPTVVDTHGLLRNLAQNNTHGYTFGMSLLNEEPHTLVGASPELLVKKAGIQIIANPLAGSAARSEDPIEDERRAVALLASSKDRHEHAVVVAAVAAALHPYCKTLVVPDEPSLVQTNTMWHLSTEIVGELDDIRTSVLELAVALHPTPAVCGTPTDLAREVIKEIEIFERGFYTGMVGWCDSNGDGEWAVTIRCAEVAGRSLRLFAGAGIVGGSTGEAELAETSAKFQTLFVAMGLKQQVDEMGE